ncbi:MAG: EAL domain-containing protein [Bordetella sp.]|uniref:EAL domain-containing protein n=1 Tax=Bordetella sp. TaxID=28081 RepID=UPI003F7C1BF1
MTSAVAYDLAYGREAAIRLQPIQDTVAALAEQFSSNFFDSLVNTAEGARILGALLEQDIAHLKAREAQHLRLLFAPQLTMSQHQETAQRIGRAHALVGVELQTLIESFALFQQEIHQEILPLIAQESRQDLLEIIEKRNFMDLQSQAGAYQRVDTELSLAAASIDELIQQTANFSDLVRGVMGIIGKVEGDLSVFFARCDTSGELQIEVSQGAAGHRYHEAMETGLVPRISIDPARASGQGPGGRAWRSGQIVVTDAWVFESRNKPWQVLGKELGFRSSAAVPLLDDSGKTIALLSLYSGWPRFFSTLRIGTFLNHLQKMLSHAVESLNTVPVISLPLRQRYRAQISQKKVTFFYQPIIDLRSGELRKVEALARVLDEDGHIVTPNRFLPACGNEELFELLELGLAQAQTDAAVLTGERLCSLIALNFPAEGIGDPRCERAILQAVERCQSSGVGIELELLESREGHDTDEHRYAFLQKLRDAGIRLAQDDLGSGHSSLLRLDKYAFDEVKMDQGFVRGATQRPQRALEFMLYLTRLVHAFDMRVTVEGLEHRGLIEGALILGADLGQGYGIARPMPVHDLPAWHDGFRYDVDSRRPKTALGALATYLLWDTQAIASHYGEPDDLVDARRIMEAFIAERGLERTELAGLLAEHFERGGSARSRIRAHVIAGLTQIWHAETGAP